jgi:tetratricopeptide (TPR) repeat protein
LRALFTVLLFFAFSFADSAEEVLEYAYQTEYDKAFGAVLETDSGACVLKGILYISRFDDLGDTLDLDSAVHFLKTCKPNDFWEPFRRYQNALLNSILGRTVKSFMEARGAARIFEKRPDADSKAFYAIYGYAVSFTRAGKNAYLADLKNGFEQSKIFSPVFGNSLIWYLYEEKKYAEALNIVDVLLKRYPEHPVFLQTKADMLFKLGKVDEAVAIYKQSEQLYAKRAVNSIRYWCAVSNLAKMTGDIFWKEKLKSEEYRSMKHWMPDIFLH